MKKTFGFMMVGTNNLADSEKFYNAIFLPLDLCQVLTTERYIGYAQKENPKEIKFYITKPVNKKPATYGNGTQISFLVDTKKKVEEFHMIGLKNGGINEGLPGIRSGDYYAYIRDLDGNKICAYCTLDK
tara:strand:+ start:71 stop:457 length:387 start_codon:yes stop_codon:yes gene_type:complete